MKKGKTIITTLLAIFLIAATMFTLTACGHVHEYDEKWTTDATNHRHVCTGDDCKEVSDKAAHTFVDKNSDTQYWLECSVCGYQQDKIDAKFTNEQLKNAIQFKDADGNYYTNVVAECEGYNTLSSNIVKNVKFTENAYYIYESNNDGTSLAKEKIYINEADGTKVTYTKMNENADWTKITESHLNFQSYAKTNVFMYGTDGMSFEYNKADCTYIATKVESTTTTKNTIKFANGKLVSVVVEKIKNSTQTAIVQYTWTISYGTATIEIPTITTAE